MKRKTWIQKTLLTTTLMLAAAAWPFSAQAQQCVAGAGGASAWYVPSCQTP